MDKFGELKRLLDRAIAQTGSAPLPLLRGFVLLGERTIETRYAQNKKPTPAKKWTFNPESKLRAAVRAFAQAMAWEAITAAGGNRNQAAAALGISPDSLRRLVGRSSRAIETKPRRKKNIRRLRSVRYAPFGGPYAAELKRSVVIGR